MLWYGGLCSLLFRSCVSSSLRFGLVVVLMVQNNVDLFPDSILVFWLIFRFPCIGLCLSICGGSDYEDLESSTNVFYYVSSMVSL